MLTSSKKAFILLKSTYKIRSLSMERINLTDHERQELLKMRKLASSKDSEKAFMILLYDDGYNAIEIGERMHRNPHTVRKWIKRYISKGLSGLSRNYSPGRPSIRSQVLIPLLEKWLLDSPQKYGYVSSEWTVYLLREQYYRETGEATSGDTMQRALKDAGFSYKRPKKSVPSCAPSKEEKRQRVLELIEEIRKFIGTEDAEIFALDETYFTTEPYLIRGWLKKKVATI
jgi:transposase